MILLAAALAYAGFLALCLSMARHHREMFGRHPRASRRMGLRVLGWALLGLSAWACITAWGWALGTVGWFGLLTLVALGLVFLLPYAPRLAALLGPALPALALLLHFGFDFP